MFKFSWGNNQLERSVLAAFLLLTIVPLTAIGLFTIWQINSESLAVAKAEQRTTAKAYGLTLMQRISYLADHSQPLLQNHEVVRKWFENHWMIKRIGAPTDVSSWSHDRPVLVREGKSIYLGVPDNGRLFWVEIAGDLWWFDLEEVPNNNRLCVLIDQVEVACGEKPVVGEVVGTKWPLFLESFFDTNFELSVMAEQSEADIYSATTLVSRILPAMIGLACVLIALLGAALIRRKFRPLIGLKEATIAIENGDYRHRVGVDTDDEFGQLGEAFNRMTSRLDQSFSTMRLLADVDRLMLSSPNIETIIERVMQVSLTSAAIESAWAVLGTTAQPEKPSLYTVDDEGVCRVDKAPWAQLLVDRQWDVSAEEICEITRLPITHVFQVQCEGDAVGILAIRCQRAAYAVLNRISEMADRLSVASTNLRHARNLFQQAHFDGLTGLLNRSAFSDRLGQAVAHAIRTDTPGVLVYIDLDRFKQVNDTEGHKAGDRMLKVIGTRLSGVLREIDSLARLGGDEFGLILPAMSNEVEIIAVCDRVIREIERPVLVENIEHTVSLSIGLAMFPGDGKDAETLLMRADAAMYHSKEASGSRYTFFDQRINAINHRRVQVEARLRKAIMAKELVLVFQPKLELKTNQITGCEALMRWHDEELGHVAPDEFIAVAEATGLIHAIEPMLADQVMDFLGACDEMGCPMQHVAINASPRQIANEGYADRLISQINDRGYEPSRFQVEVTESLFINDSQKVSSELAQLREQGISVALDDFGTGFSSLNMLTQIPLDVIKIDRAFLLPMETSVQSRELLRHIISIAVTLDKKVVAEGVEDEKQLRFLHESGCHYLQGYLISRPLPPDEFIEFATGFEAARELSA
jgi:diguanylate cyclase (GGDEF)-like protein